MTRHFIEAVDEAGFEALLVDRRFSRHVHEVGKFRTSKLPKAFFLWLRIAWTALSRRPVVCVIFCTNRKFSFVIDCASIFLIRLVKIPIINYIHTSGYSNLAGSSQLAHRLVSYMITGAEVNIVLGHKLLKDIESLSGSTPSVVVPNTAGTASDATFAPSPNDGPVVFLSNLIPSKGAHIFLEVCILLAAARPHQQFVLAGASVDESITDGYRRRALESGLEDRLKIVTDVNETNKWSLLSTASLLLFPSTYHLEAQPLTIIEAMSVGTPVLAFDIGGVGDIVINDVTGVLLKHTTDSASVRLMEATALDLLNDKDRLAKLRSSSRRHYAASHSRRAYLEQWSEILRHFGNKSHK